MHYKITGFFSPNEGLTLCRKFRQVFYRFGGLYYAFSKRNYRALDFVLDLIGQVLFKNVLNDKAVGLYHKRTMSSYSHFDFFRIAGDIYIY